jgi:hypothetical protein
MTEMKKPSYESFVQQEALEVSYAFTQRHKTQPAPQDLYHNAWRRLAEGWSHENILRDINGEPLIPDPIPEDGKARLTLDSIRASGPYFYEEGQEHAKLWRWKGITAFSLLKRFLLGDDITPNLRWYKFLGINVLRVFTQVDWGSGTDSLGHKVSFFAADYNDLALHEFLTLCEEHALRVEYVAHTFPYDIPKMKAHTRRVAAICMEHRNAFLEIANEPQRNKIPWEVYSDTPVALYATGDYSDEIKARGQYITHHSGRDSEWARKFKDAYEMFTGAGPHQVMDPFHGPVILDEPIRADDTTAHRYEDYGRGAALFSAGATFHYKDGLWTLPPESTDVTIWDKARSFIAGLDSLPLQEYRSYGHPPDEGNLRRYIRIGADNLAYEVRVRM